MKIFHSEQFEGFTLTVAQEWDGAGLMWQLEIPAAQCWPLPRYFRQSGGRFYPDQNGEIIHGATIADVVQTARNSAVTFLNLNTR